MCTHTRRTSNIPLKQRNVLVSLATRPIGASASETYWVKKGICLLRSLMNWGIIIQHSATTVNNIQIQFRKYCKAMDLCKSHGGRERQTAEKRATGMFWVPTQGWVFGVRCCWNQLTC